MSGFNLIEILVYLIQVASWRDKLKIERVKLSRYTHIALNQGSEPEALQFAKCVCVAYKSACIDLLLDHACAPRRQSIWVGTRCIFSIYAAMPSPRRYYCERRTAASDWPSRGRRGAKRSGCPRVARACYLVGAFRRYQPQAAGCDRPLPSNEITNFFMALTPTRNQLLGTVPQLVQRGND